MNTKEMNFKRLKKGWDTDEGGWKTLIVIGITVIFFMVVV